MTSQQIQLLPNQAELGQYFSPTWACELLLRKAFPRLPAGAVLCDPTCGDGRWLVAAPAIVDAFGCEIDPPIAEAARQNSGRPVVTGDFLTATLPMRPTHFAGNPPFELDLFAAIMGRCYDELEYGGVAGFILPAYFFQTPNTLLTFKRKWTIEQDMLPRALFDRLQKQLIWARFTKERRTRLVNFFLYEETAALASLRDEYRAMFIGNASRASVWRDTVVEAVQACGATATLQQLYAAIENNRPTENPWWREKVRQVVARLVDEQQLARVRPGVYTIQPKARAAA